MRGNRTKVAIAFLVAGCVLAATRPASAAVQVGACCIQGTGCDTAIYIGDGFWCCNGICQPGPFGGSCAYVSCHLGGGVCANLPRVCCAQQGDPMGAGDDCNNNGVHDACDPTEACCTSPTGCQNVTEGCCTSGASAGPGTACGDADGNGLDDECGEPRACCVPDTHVPTPLDLCDAHELYVCVVTESGTPVGPAGGGCFGLSDDDDDNVPDPCDNCDPTDPAQCGVGEDCANNDQIDDDGDGVGNQCDNCDPNVAVHHCNDPGFSCNNPNQADADGDDVGDTCDNCNMYNPDQADCDGNGIGDICQPDCDLDGIIDACDPDIDGDGIGNDDDVCDFTPDLPTANGGDVVRDAGHPLYGTFLADMDGDCDVDDNDSALFDVLFDTEETGDGACTGNDDTEQREVGCGCASAGCCLVCPPPCDPCPPCGPGGGGGGMN